MADACGECMAVFCGFCCICCTSSLSNWCLMKSCGVGSGKGRGCICCKKGFDDDEDEFAVEEARLHELQQANDALDAQERRMRREREQRQSAAPDAGRHEPQVINAQPRAEVQMDAGRRSGVGERRSNVGEKRSDAGERPVGVP